MGLPRPKIFFFVKKITIFFFIFLLVMPIYGGNKISASGVSRSGSKAEDVERERKKIRVKVND